MNRTLYTALFYLGLPLVAIRLWLRARKAPAYAKRIGERFSYRDADDEAGRHLGARGVGGRKHCRRADDSRLAGSVIRHLPITVTCMTPTGSERIQALFANEPRIQHCYLPYDLPCAAAALP